MAKSKQSSKSYISILIRGFKHLGTVELAEEFFNILQETGEMYIPTKIGLCEPMKIMYSIENAKKIWVESDKRGKYGGGILFKMPSGFGSVDWINIDNSNYSSLKILSNNILTNKGVEQLITFAKKLFIWSNGIYGHICHEAMPLYSRGLDYKTCLPGITWLNLFGKPYVDLFGENVIESAPCYVDKFSEKSYALLTSDKPIRVTPELLEIHERVKNHLGKEAFDRKEPLQTTYSMEDIQAGRHLSSTEGYRSPDLSEYIKSATKKNDEELFAVVNNNYTISTYKRKLTK